MHAVRRGYSCENMQAVTNTVLATRRTNSPHLRQERDSRQRVESPSYCFCSPPLAAAMFHRHGNLVTAVVQLGSLLIFLLVCVTLGFSCYGSCLAKICTPPSPRKKGVVERWSPADCANSRKYALDATRERIAKICAPPKSYYPCMGFYPPSAEWLVQPPHL